MLNLKTYLIVYRGDPKISGQFDMKQIYATSAKIAQQEFKAYTLIRDVKPDMISVWEQSIEATTWDQI